MNRFPAIGLTVLMILLPSCSAHQFQQQLSELERDIGLNNEAWTAARSRLQAMCPNPPKTREEYAKIKGSYGCDIRFVKMTNGLADDWDWGWLPSYQTIVQIHEEEVRKGVPPKVYEEYMIGVSRYLAEKADRGEITPAQLKFVFNHVWQWMHGQMRGELALSQSSLRAAQESDAAMWNAFANVAIGVANVTAVALIASAQAQAYNRAVMPWRVVCNAQRVGAFVNVICN